MSLVVEDGTGLANAESYASVVTYRAYLAARGIVDTDTDTQIEQRLRAATDYMQGEYEGAWKGTRIGIVQALDWPRYNVVLNDLPGGYSNWPYIVPPNTLPVPVANACVMLAYKAKTTDLAPDIEQNVKMEKVDVIEVEYMDGSTPITTYRAIDFLVLRYLIRGAGNTAQAIRC